MAFQKRQILLLKAHAPVMLFLLCNVIPHHIHVALPDAERRISALPSKVSNFTRQIRIGA